jgi:farnesyl diphosphate synthase
LSVTAGGVPPGAGFAGRIESYRQRIELALERTLAPATTHPARFHSAMRYAVLGGGKRLRPLLVYATAEWLGLEPTRVDPLAVALELVHAYSLVHDDLPAMDDDHLRRGRATVHIAFDEATAILVGDALQALAYDVLARDSGLRTTPDIQVRLVRDLAAAGGSEGMVGGQALDVAATGRSLSPAEFDDMAARKTGRLLHAAVIMPCRLRPDLDARTLTAAEGFGRAVGLAFQVADDLLDIEGTAAVIGKPQGSDARHRKPTLPALVGVEGARRRLVELHAEALAAIAASGAQADSLRWICDTVVSRNS